MKIMLIQLEAPAVLQLDEDLLVKDFGSLSTWKILQLQGLLSEESNSQVKVVIP